ncbi:MAG: type II secretion system protein N [Roseovarius sp.]|nr:type II secretion system protein N [Roseovarius sp.]
MTDQTEIPAATLKAATQESALPGARLSLLGTLHGPKSARALLRKAGRVETVTTGDRIDNATVAAIGEGVVILARGGRTERLALPGT